MRTVFCDCSVSYNGRGNTYLSRGLRLVLIKDDGSVAIHQDKGIKPLNYMSKSTAFSEHDDEAGNHHIIASSNRETIDITVYNILDERFYDFDESTDLERHGTEAQIQEWLALDDNLREATGMNLSFITREYETGKGPVDIIAYDKNNQLVLVEVKRYAKKNDSFQVLRYRVSLEQERDKAISVGAQSIRTTSSGIAIPVSALNSITGILVAPKFHKGAVDVAKSIGVKAVKIKTPF